MGPNPIPFPIRAVFFDLDGVIVSHPSPGHNRLDYQRLEFLKNICIFDRKNYHSERIEAIQDRLSVGWNAKDPFNEHSTDLSFALGIITGTYFSHSPHNTFASEDEIDRAKKYIVEADRYYKTLQFKLNDFETYEHNPKLVQMLKLIQKQNPEVGFFPNSGNSRKMTEIKARATGLDGILTMDKLPNDPPIFGEDIQERSDGVDWALAHAKIPKEGAIVLFSDRPADATALKNIHGYNDYHIFFGDSPFDNKTSHRINIGDRPNNLYFANQRGRVLFVPPGLNPQEQVDLIGDFFSVNRLHAHPEGKRLSIA